MNLKSLEDLVKKELAKLKADTDGALLALEERIHTLEQRTIDQTNLGQSDTKTSR